MRIGQGDTLQGGKYTIEDGRPLREGPTSVSYLARRDDGSRWVIKVLDPQILASLSDDAERDRVKSLFVAEAVKLVRCSGTPHIVRAEMPFVEGDLACLPVEYLGGDSLAERRQPRLTESVALEYVRQVGKALAVVHGQGLVHRDIRPSNIFLRIEGSRVDAVLTGFGLAVDCDTALTRTRTRELIDGFSPFELYGHGRPVGAYTDVYSLAATLYELLTGVVPANALERKDGVKTLMPLQTINPDITGSTSRAIDAGMAVWPTEKRPQSVVDWLATLEDEPPATVPIAAKVEVTPKRVTNIAKNPVNWATWVGSIAALLAVVAAVLMWHIDRMDTNSVKPEPSTVKESPDVPEADDAEQKPSSPDTAP